MAVSGEEFRLVGPELKQCLEALQMRASLMWEEYREDLLAHSDAVEVPTEQLAGGRVLAAFLGTDLIGFAALEHRLDGAAELDGLFVEAGYWGNGIGRRLVNAICRLVVTRYRPVLHVIANPRAEGFYLRCGFEKYGTSETRFGRGLLMRRDC